LRDVLTTHRGLVLATSASKPFDRPGWLFELNLDGYRMLAIRHATKRGCCSLRQQNARLSEFQELSESEISPECVLVNWPAGFGCV